MAIGMGGSTGRGREVCIENDFTIWTNNWVRLSGGAVGATEGGATEGGAAEMADDVLAGKGANSRGGSSTGWVQGVKCRRGAVPAYKDGACGQIGFCKRWQRSRGRRFEGKCETHGRASRKTYNH